MVHAPGQCLHIIFRLLETNNFQQQQQQTTQKWKKEGGREGGWEGGRKHLLSFSLKRQYNLTSTVSFSVIEVELIYHISFRCAA